MSALRSLAHNALWAPYEAPQPLAAGALRRARMAAVATLLAGALLLWVTLRIPAGDPWFYPATLALALVWAVGGLAGARPRRGWIRYADGSAGSPAWAALVLGVGLVLVFLVGAVVVARVPLLRAPVDALLDHAQLGSMPVVLALTMLNGIAEELFFRGTLYDAFPRGWAVAGTVVVYGAVTAASGVPLLVLAGIILGLVTVLQRRASGGLLGPVITHLTWSASMLILLPPALGQFG